MKFIKSPSPNFYRLLFMAAPSSNIKSFQFLERQRNQNFELMFGDHGANEGEFNDLKPFVDTYIKLNQNTGAYLARNIGAVFAKAPIIFSSRMMVFLKKIYLKHILMHFKIMILFPAEVRIFPNLKIT